MINPLGLTILTIDLLSRLTVHMDEELRMLTHQSLQTLVIDFPDWRQDVVHGYTQFLVRDVTDTYPQLLENCTRMLFVFLNIWRCAINVNGNGNSGTNTLKTPTSTGLATATNAGATNTQSVLQPGTAVGTGIVGKDTATSQLSSASNVKSINTNSSATSSITSSGMSTITQATVINMADAGKKNEIPLATTLHFVEGYALVLLCNYRPYLRKLAAMILKEVKNLMKALGIPETEPPLLDVIDKCCPQVSSVEFN